MPFIIVALIHSASYSIKSFLYTCYFHMFEERNRKILRVYQLMIICIWKSIGEILCVEFVWYFSSVKYDYVFFYSELKSDVCSSAHSIWERKNKSIQTSPLDEWHNMCGACIQTRSYSQWSKIYSWSFRISQNDACFPKIWLKWLFFLANFIYK